MDLKLICEPLVSEREFIETDFFEKEIGRFIPLARNPLDNEQIELKNIGGYIKQNPPYISSVHFTNLTGGTPRYLRRGPNWSEQDETIWNEVYGLWVSFIKKLIEDGTKCFMLVYNLSAEDYHDFLPSTYDGNIVFREDKTAILFECTKELLELHSDLFVNDLWSRWTEAFFVSPEDEGVFQELASETFCTPEIVENFFSKLVAFLEVRYESEGVWFVSHKFDHKALYDLFEVDKVNEYLKLK